VTKITHADSTYQSFSHDAYGNKLWEENELRQRTSYTYDNYNRVLTATRIMRPGPKRDHHLHLRPHQWHRHLALSAHHQ
jgi:hypothetical protein